MTTTSSSRGKVVPKIGFAIKIRALKDSKISNFPVSAPTTPNNENSRPKLIGEQRRYSPLGDRTRPSYKHDHNTVQKKNMRTLWRPNGSFVYLEQKKCSSWARAPRQNQLEEFYVHVVVSPVR